jgi:hypothetical protein
MADRLKLRARDAGDLDMIAAVVQDGLVPIADMTYRPREQRFALMLNRFRWEAASGQAGREPRRAPQALPEAEEDARFADGHAAFERMHSALVFEHVRAVKHRGLKQAARGGVLALLTLRVEGAIVYLSFAGGAAIRLELERLSCFLEDLGEPWPTAWRPDHKDSGTSGGPR